MSHYYDENVNLKSERKSFKFTFKNEVFTFTTDNGVFSKGYIDFGTKTLLENFKESTLDGPILDMCCGYGVVGIILKKFTTSNIYLTDIN
ncbi:protein containing Methyltransferase small domain protein, partial [gut metagenome]